MIVIVFHYKVVMVSSASLYGHGRLRFSQAALVAGGQHPLLPLALEHSDAYKIFQLRIGVRDVCREVRRYCASKAYESSYNPAKKSRANRPATELSKKIQTKSAPRAKQSKHKKHKNRHTKKTKINCNIYINTN